MFLEHDDVKHTVFHDVYCCDHEDQKHRPYCWDLLLLYVQTLNTTSDGIPRQNAETHNEEKLLFSFHVKIDSSFRSRQLIFLY